MIESHLSPISSVQLHLPIEVADYVDFYASENHAANVGQMFRPGGDPLTPNWKHMPIGYHGRAGTVVVSGTDVVRPRGQVRSAGDPRPTFGPSRKLDFEAELGWVVGVGSSLGAPVLMEDFREHVFGVVVLNDWSARDLQAWEYVPLGPFLGKSFATSISAWVLPLEALDDAQIELPGREPELLPYLRAATTGYDIDVAGDGQRPVGQHLPVRADVLLAGADARTSDDQRRPASHRGSLRVRHDFWTGRRATRQPARADLERLPAPRSRCGRDEDLP